MNIPIGIDVIFFLIKLQSYVYKASLDFVLTFGQTYLELAKCTDSYGIHIRILFKKYISESIFVTNILIAT